MACISGSCSRAPSGRVELSIGAFGRPRKRSVTPKRITEFSAISRPHRSARQARLLRWALRLVLLLGLMKSSPSDADLSLIETPASSFSLSRNSFPFHITAARSCSVAFVVGSHSVAQTAAHEACVIGCLLFL